MAKCINMSDDPGLVSVTEPEPEPEGYTHSPEMIVRYYANPMCEM